MCYCLNLIEHLHFHEGEGPWYKRAVGQTQLLLEGMEAQFRRATHHEPVPGWTPDWDALDYNAEPKLFPAVSTRKPENNRELEIGTWPNEEQERFMSEEGNPENVV